MQWWWMLKHFQLTTLEKCSVTGQCHFPRPLELHNFVEGDWKVSVGYFYRQYEKEGMKSLASTCSSESNAFHKSRKRKSGGIVVIKPCPLLAAEAYQNLLARVKSVAKIYDVPLQELLDSVEQPDEEITKGVYAMPWVSPYCAHRIAGSANSGYNRLVFKDMITFYGVLYVVMDVKELRHIFCFALQFKSW